MEQQFTTVDAYLTHLRETQGDKFAEVALAASLTKSTLHTIVGALDMSNPEKCVGTLMTVGKCFTGVMIAMTKIGGLTDKVHDLTAAADKIFDLAATQVADATSH